MFDTCDSMATLNFIIFFTSTLNDVRLSFIFPSSVFTSPSSVFNSATSVCTLSSPFCKPRISSRLEPFSRLLSLRLRCSSSSSASPSAALLSPPPVSAALNFLSVAVSEPAPAPVLGFDRRRPLVPPASTSSSSPSSFVSALVLLTLLVADEDETGGEGDVRGAAACFALSVLAPLSPVAVGVPRPGLPPLGFGVDA